MQETKNQVATTAVFMAFGNKTDLEGQRTVDKEEARKFFLENGCQYMEGSVLTGEGVEEMVLAAIQQELLLHMKPEIVFQ